MSSFGGLIVAMDGCDQIRDIPVSIPLDGDCKCHTLFALDLL